MKPFNVAVLVGSLRRESINRKLAEAVIRVAPDSLSFRHVDLGALPMYNGDLEANRPRGEPVHGGNHARRRPLGRHAGAQPLASGGAQERHRLGLQAERSQRLARQAGRYDRHVARRLPLSAMARTIRSWLSFMVIHRVYRRGAFAICSPQITRPKVRTIDS